MSSRSVLARAAGLAAIVLIVTACSSDAEPVSTAPTETLDPATAGDPSHGCVDTVIVGASPNNVDFAGSHAVAVPGDDGTVSLYLSSFEFDPADGTDSVPDGNSVFHIVIDPGGETLAAGDELSFGAAPGYSIEAFDGPFHSEPAEGAEGQLWVTEAGDRLCGEVSFFETDMRLSGTFDAGFAS